MLGSVIGSYRIVAEIGRGGMGAVYEGEHTLIGRKAAIKMLRRATDNQSVLSRFFNEAKAATAIKHPGIVDIYDYGYHEVAPYITMELLEGETLRDRLRRQRALGYAESIKIVTQIARALEAAHDAGIIHRDLKPANIFLVPDPELGERVKLLDFGIAKLNIESEETSHETKTGAVIGTPAYMSPEQCRGAGGVDHRTDLYALGCIWFHLVCGRTPFTVEGSGAMIGAHMYERPPSPRSICPDLPVAIEAAILRLMAKPPDQRFATATELLAALPRTDGAASSESQSFEAAPASSPSYPAVAANTTLGGSTGTLDEVTARRPRWWIPIAASATLALGIAAWASGSGGDDADAGQVRSAAAETASARADRADEPAADAPDPFGAAGEHGGADEHGEDGEDLADDPADPATSGDGADPAGDPVGAHEHGAGEHDASGESPGAAAAPQVAIAIASDPSGAEVFLSGQPEPLGQTPYTHIIAASDDELKFVVKKPRYKPAKLAVSARADASERVDLEPVRRARTRRAPLRKRTRRALTPKERRQLEQGGIIRP